MSTIRVVNSGPDTIKVTVNETPKVNVSSPANSVVKVSLGASGSPGSSTFLGLSDTPASFTASKFLKVNSDGNAVELVDTPSGSSTFLELTDTPPSFTASKFLKVNSDGNAVEFVDTPGGVSTILGLSDTPSSFTGKAGKFVKVNSSANAVEFVSDSNLDTVVGLLKSNTGSTTLTGDGSGSSTDDGRLELTPTAGKVKFATNSEMELTATTAKLKTGVTELKLTETSPGDIEFIVATDASGSTAFTAVHIDGGANANEADLNINNGTTLKIHGASGSASLGYAGSGAQVALPSAGGTLLANVREDGSPQLGGDLDLNGNKITSASNADILIEPNGTGDINLSADTINLSDNANTGRIEIATNEIILKSSTVGTIWKAATNANRFTIEQPLALGSSASPSSTTILNSRNDNKTHILCENAAGDDKFTVAINSDGNATTTVADTFIASGLTYPSSDGSANQVLKTDGSGNLSFVNQTADTNTQNSYAISCVDGDNSDEEKIRLTQSGADGADTDDIVLEAGTGLSIARDGDKITFTNTVSDTQLSTEQVQDIAGPLVATGGTKTGITVTYDDASNNMDFVVDSDLSTTGNAGTATALATARNIAGVSFDGTADISLNNNAITNGAGYTTNTGTVDTTGTPVDNDFAKFTDANTIEGRSIAEVKSDLSLDNVENTAISTFAGTSNITTVGTIGTGTWQGTAIASTYLDADTAHLSGTQTFTGAKTFSDSIQVDNINVNANTISSTDTNGNVLLAANGTGKIEVRGNTNSGAIVLNCEENTHGVTIQAPAHGASWSGSYTLTLPADDGDANQVLQTNGSGVLDWVDQTVDTNTQNTTTLSFEDSTDDIILRNTTGGAGSGTQDIKFVAGSNITLSYTDANNITIAATTGTGSATFVGLSDTPGSFTASKFLKVNSDGDAIEFVDNPSGGLSNIVEDTTPQLGGDLDTNGKNVLFAKTGNTDHSSNGDIVKIGTGSTTQGELCYYTSSGTWVAANAGATGTAGGVLLAIALGTDPDVDGMLLRGMYTLDHDPGTVGDELYVSTTAGDITSTAPSGTGDVVRVIGYCLDSTNGQIWFNPSNDFIVLA
jgi:hypothetical protein